MTITMQIDEELAERLAIADRERTAIERLDDTELTTLLAFATKIYQQDPSPKSDLRAYLRAWIYGMQIGHDLALSGGAVLSASEGGEA